MKLVRTSCGVWVIMFFLFLPFPYFLFPNFGESLSNLISPIVKFFGIIFGTELSQSNFHSDSIHLYLQLFTTLILSIVIGSLLIRLKSINQDRLSTFLYTVASYILAFFLIKYGCDKLFKYQFYDAAPNTLFTPVGYLSKDILFWTSMGSSHSYNVFMGLIEIIPGLLLLWNRTRVLGALIGLGVLTNVLAINIGFDITVKILSTMLVFTALFILERHFRRLWKFFVLNTATEAEQLESLIEKPTLKRAIKGLVVSLIIIESLFVYISADAWNADNLPKIKYYGSYTTTRQIGHSSVLDLNNIKRIHIHNSGYLITEDLNGNFNDYRATISSGSNRIALVDEKIELFVKEENKTLSFISNSPGNQFRIITDKIDLKKLPFHFDSFHWTVDSFATE